MKAIHVNWTKPFFERHRLRGHGFESTRSMKSDCYDQTDHQVLYTILSAVHWNLHNGPIKLYTDSIGLEFYQQFGIVDMYSDVDIKFLNAYSKSNIDAAAGNVPGICLFKGGAKKLKRKIKSRKS